MADPQKPTRTKARGPHLPALERLAPPPDLSTLTAQIEARTKAGEVVLELHGRGGWVSRSAIDQLRRSFAIETTALTRLVAEVVLRPPDLRHFDAAISGIAVDARGMEGGLRSAIEANYISRCAACGGTVVVDEFIWEAGASDPSRKSYRCSRCRDGRNDGRPVAVDPDDLYLSRAIEADAAQRMLRERFPAPTSDDPLPQEMVDLYPPRAQLALAAILERIEMEERAPSVQAALRLAVVEMALPVSRLNGYPGRVAQVRIAGGHVRGSASRRWRERNVWAAFDEGTQAVRAFVLALESGGHRSPARVGPDLRALVDGSANVALRFGMPLGRETFGPPPRPGVEPGARPRVRAGISLVLSQPPIHWSPDNLAFAYLANSLAVGPEGAATLPLASLFGAAAKNEWARDAATLQSALTAVQPVLLPEAKAVIVLEHAASESLVASVIGGVGAGLRVDDAVLAESEAGISGTIEFALPTSAANSERDVAIHSASEPSGPFQIAKVEAAIADIAVAVMQLRGEPTRFDRILGEVLLGLDHLGHLRRLVGSRRPAPEDDEARPPRAPGLFGVVSDAPDGSRQAASAVTLAGTDTEPTEEPDADGEDDVGEVAAKAGQQSIAWDDSAPASDPVRLTLEIIRKELGKPDHPRLDEIDENLWWLRDERDLAAAKPALSERVEWGIFSLLSTSGGITEASFEERVRRLFRGPETADEGLVDACVASYRSASPSDDGLIRTDESLQRRYAEHGEMVGMLSDYGHRLGMRIWISQREQRRRYGEATLGDLLGDPEQRVYLPLVAPGPQEVLEEIDCIWYVRGRGAFLFDVEWMAVLDEPILKRGPQIETSDSMVRFLVIPDERASLVRLRLARSPVLRERMSKDNWHILKWSNVHRLHAAERPDLAALGPLLGLDPDVERGADQMAMFAK
ncbi:MAG: hypothetical protein ACC726_06850 [Chloroflexota bacterium]